MTLHLVDVYSQGEKLLSFLPRLAEWPLLDNILSDILH